MKLTAKEAFKKRDPASIKLDYSSGFLIVKDIRLKNTWIVMVGKTPIENFVDIFNYFIVKFMTEHIVGDYRVYVPNDKGIITKKTYTYLMSLQKHFDIPLKDIFLLRDKFKTLFVSEIQAPEYKERKFIAY